jgi:hypothetical protein
MGYPYVLTDIVSRVLRGRGKEFLLRAASVVGFVLVLSVVWILGFGQTLRPETLTISAIIGIGVIALVVVVLVQAPSEKVEEILRSVDQYLEVITTIRRELDKEAAFSRRTNKVNVEGVRRFLELWSVHCACSALCRRPSYLNMRFRRHGPIGDLRNQLADANERAYRILRKSLTGEMGIEGIMETRDITCNIHDKLLPALSESCRVELERAKGSG